MGNGRDRSLQPPLHACAVGTVPRTVRKAARSGTAPYSLSPIACLLLSTIHYKPSTIFPLVARRSLLVAILYPPSTINHPLFFPSRPGPFFFFSLNLNYLKLKSFPIASRPPCGTVGNRSLQPPLHACHVGTVPRTVRKAARSGTRALLSLFNPRQTKCFKG